MLSKRTNLFVWVLLAALIACNLPSSAAAVVPTNISTLTVTAPTSPSESSTQAPEQAETQPPDDQPNAPPPTVAAAPTIPGATTPPTVEPTPTTESDPPASGGVVDHVIVYGRDPIYKGGTAHIGWEAPGVGYVSIAAYGVDDYQSGSSIQDYDPARLAGQTAIKVYSSLPPTGSLEIYIPPDFAHQHMMLAVLPPDHDVTTISSSVLAVIYPNEPGPDSTLYDFSGGLAIREFGIDPPTAERGGQIAMWWEVVGATEIGISRLSEKGGMFLGPAGWDLDPIGYLSFSISDYYINQVNFMLIARNEAGDQVQQIVTAAIACPFDTSLTDDCPITRTTVEAAYQPFEHGFMVWTASSSGDPAKIYVMYDDTTWREYEDTWLAGETFDVGETPPEGFYQPEHGFGKVWATEADVRSKLGWAAEPEVGYTADVETHKYYFGHYEGASDHIVLPDGQVLHLETPWRID